MDNTHRVTEENGNTLCIAAYQLLLSLLVSLVPTPVSTTSSNHFQLVDDLQGSPNQTL